MLRTLNRWLLVASALAAAVCFFNRNALPAGTDVDARLESEPKQKAVTKAPLTVGYAGVDYRVEPLYDYELYGLVVSLRQHDGTSLMHSRANDKLNVADICVVWSDTAFSEHLHELDFWNGIFTCNVQTRDSVAWASFKMHQLANNHLISDDPFIRDRVADVRVGDQIRVQGWLARYGAAGGAVRGTSTTRDDTGDGACETIFVRQLEIIERGFSAWRAGLYAALALLIVTLGVHFALPYRPYRD
jgi:hypothetical protein